MKFIFVFTLLLFSSQVFAYSNFIGHGYTSCLNCHFNPTGGGPLNDYGRVVSATLISSNAFYPASMTEEQVAHTSGFLFRKPKQDWLRTQVNYRGFQLVNHPGGRKETKRWINMQLDARAIVKFGENDRFVAVGNFGYAPSPQTLPTKEKQSDWRSREYYLGYRFTPKVGVYAGLMDKVFGLKVIEHIAFSRTVPQAAQNDQVHGVMAHYLGEKWETTGQFFLGNMGQDENIRSKGASLTTERTIFDNHRLGLSVLKSKNEFFDLSVASLHTRINLKEGSALLAEFGQSSRKTANKSDDRSERYGLLQTYLRPFRGLYFLTNVEYYQANIKEEPYIVRWGPGVQYFPIQRVELRLDVYNTRSFNPSSSAYDSWMYLFQTHLWL